MEKIKVILAEDHPVMRKAIKTILERAVQIEVVGETGRGDEARELAIQFSPDVLVADVHLPELDGDEVARQLKLCLSPVRTLIVSAEADPVYIGELLREDIYGYLVKDDIPNYLVDAVCRVAAGEKGWFGAQSKI